MRSAPDRTDARRRPPTGRSSRLPPPFRSDAARKGTPPWYGEHDIPGHADRPVVLEGTFCHMHKPSSIRRAALQIHTTSSVLRRAISASRFGTPPLSAMRTSGRGPVDRQPQRRQGAYVCSPRARDGETVRTAAAIERRIRGNVGGSGVHVLVIVMSQRRPKGEYCLERL
jgi:hypothetical protein